MPLTGGLEGKGGGVREGEGGGGTAGFVIYIAPLPVLVRSNMYCCVGNLLAPCSRICYQVCA